MGKRARERRSPAFLEDCELEALDEYLAHYNFDRAHTGRLTSGRVPADIVFGARNTRPVR